MKELKPTNLLLLFALLTFSNVLLVAEPHFCFFQDDSSEQRQPTLSEILRQSILFLYSNKPIDTVPSAGTTLGTAFLIGFPVEVEADSIRYIPFVVTAKHVVADHRIVLGRYNSSTGGEPVLVPYDINALRASDDYWEHDDEGVDIALFRTLSFNNTTMAPIPMELIASKSVIVKEQIGPIDRVVIPCLLQRYPGTSANYPIFRDGSIALITQESIDYDWQLGSRVIKTKQPLIFVNAAFNEGFSGAPILLSTGFRLITGGVSLNGKPWLVGLVQGFFHQDRHIVDEKGNKVSISKEQKDILGMTRIEESHIFSQENPATGVAFPAWRILEIIDSERFQSRMRTLIQLAKEELKK